MNHGDAFAGIGGFGLAAKRCGMSTVWVAEIEPSARAIYSARLGHDGLRFDSDICAARDLPRLDLLTGGFPCQDLSVAGKRRGLTHSDGTATRSGLFFELVRILEESRPKWFVFENVPGLLSHDSGRTMGIVLSTLVECGYGVAWRVLDARFFGVAQRRRRVFIVGHSSGDDRRAAAVLFEPQSVRGDSAKGRAAREDLAGTPGNRLTRSHTELDGHGAYIAGTLNPGAHPGSYNGQDAYTGHLIAHSLRAEGFDASEDGTGRWTPLVAGTLQAQHGRGFSINAEQADKLVVAPAVAFAQNQRGELRTSSVAPSLNVGGGKPGEGYPAIAINLRGRDGGAMPELSDVASVRAASGGSSCSYVSPSPDPDRMRATSGISRPLDVCPVCENGPDSARYRGLGNAVAVPVVQWILRRIEQQHRKDVTP